MGWHTSTGRLTIVLLTGCVVVVILGLLAGPYYQLAAVLPVAMLAGLAVIRFPALAYYAIVVLVPFGAFRKLDIGGTEIKLDWIAAGVLFLGLAIRHVVQHRIHGNLKTRMWVPLSLFFGANIIATILSPYRDIALKEMQLLVVSYLLVLLTLFYIDRRGFTTILPQVIAYSIGLSALLGAVGYAMNISPFAVGTGSGSFRRAVGGTSDANVLSMMIVFAVPIMGFLFMQSKETWRRGLLGILFASCLAAKVVTFSRAGAVLLVVAIFGTVRLYRGRIHARNVGLIVGMMGIVVVIALCLIPQEYWVRHRALTSDGDRSVRRRTSYLYVAADAFVKAPIFGYGPGTFPQLYAKSDYSRQFASTPEDRFRRAHNTYVEVLIGAGILGLILYGMILTMALRDFGRAITAADDRSDTGMSTLIKTYRLSFMLLLVYSLLFSDLQNKMLLLSLALSQVALRLSNPEARQT